MSFFSLSLYGDTLVVWPYSPSVVLGAGKGGFAVAAVVVVAVSPRTASLVVPAVEEGVVVGPVVVDPEVGAFVVSTQKGRGL